MRGRSSGSMPPRSTTSTSASCNPIADRVGPTPEDLGQTDGVDLQKWDDVEAAGRPWLSGVEVVPLVVSD